MITDQVQIFYCLFLVISNKATLQEFLSVCLSYFLYHLDSIAYRGTMSSSLPKWHVYMYVKKAGLPLNLNLKVNLLLRGVQL